MNKSEKEETNGEKEREMGEREKERETEIRHTAKNINATSLIVFKNSCNFQHPMLSSVPLRNVPRKRFTIVFHAIILESLSKSAPI